MWISAPGASLSAGRAVEPPRRFKRLRGLTCPAAPAGVFAPSTPINIVQKINIEALTQPIKKRKKVSFA
ncbi:hypothetical protein B1NLA3E_18420 [Bacillus sp. 1NLA3E]|nr:hypothetical protein B1NLA3E_18420 [Bacillus sp. 1NLA3E]